MTRNKLFKTLIDILFVFQGFGLLGAFIIVPFGVTKINQINLNVAAWSSFFWIFLFISILAYVLFMIGLFHLRKVARYLLSSRYFNPETIHSLKKSGKFLILSAGTGLSLFLISLAIRFNSGHSTIYNSDIALPLFIGIVGLFFIIQSEALLAAKTFKDENDLTI